MVTVLENSQIVRDKQGKILYYEGTITDITERKRVEQAKSEFVSLASHQLRTPLSAVSWYSDMLLSGKQGRITQKQKQYLEKINQSNQRMINLVNDLLNLSQIELGTFIIRPQKIDLIQTARSLLNELKLANLL